MNFFEQELRKLVGQSNALTDPKYIGRACYGRVSDSIRAKLQFTTMGYADKYEALKTTLLNNTEGEIDSNIIHLRDIWGENQISDKYSSTKFYPHIWSRDRDYEWYGYQPTPADYEALAESLDEYLELFSEDMEQRYSQTMV